MGRLTRIAFLLDCLVFCESVRALCCAQIALRQRTVKPARLSTVDPATLSWLAYFSTIAGYLSTYLPFYPPHSLESSALLYGLILRIFVARVAGGLLFVLIVLEYLAVWSTGMHPWASYTSSPRRDTPRRLSTVSLWNTR